MSVAHLYCSHHAGASAQSRSRWQFSFAADYTAWQPQLPACLIPQTALGSATLHWDKLPQPTAANLARQLGQAGLEHSQQTGFQNSSTVGALCHPHRHKPGLGESSLEWARSHGLRLHRALLHR